MRPLGGEAVAQQGELAQRLRAGIRAAPDAAPRAARSRRLPRRSSAAMSRPVPRRTSTPTTESTSGDDHPEAQDLHRPGASRAPGAPGGGRRHRRGPARRRGQLSTPSTRPTATVSTTTPTRSRASTRRIRPGGIPRARSTAFSRRRVRPRAAVVAAKPTAARTRAAAVTRDIAARIPALTGLAARSATRSARTTTVVPAGIRVRTASATAVGGHRVDPPLLRLDHPGRGRRLAPSGCRRRRAAWAGRRRPQVGDARRGQRLDDARRRSIGTLRPAKVTASVSPTPARAPTPPRGSRPRARRRGRRPRPARSTSPPRERSSSTSSPPTGCPSASTDSTSTVKVGSGAATSTIASGCPRGHAQQGQGVVQPVLAAGQVDGQVARVRRRSARAAATCTRPAGVADEDRSPGSVTSGEARRAAVPSCARTVSRVGFAGRAARPRRGVARRRAGRARSHHVEPSRGPGGGRPPARPSTASTARAVTPVSVPDVDEVARDRHDPVGATGGVGQQRTRGARHSRTGPDDDRTGAPVSNGGLVLDRAVGGRRVGQREGAHGHGEEDEEDGADLPVQPPGELPATPRRLEAARLTGEPGDLPGQDGQQPQAEHRRGRR